MSRSALDKEEQQSLNDNELMANGEEDEEEEFDQEQIIQTILAIGNEIWKNFGQDEEIDDVRVFFQHSFYIQCFQIAYPSIDFSQLLSGENDESEEKMAECI